MLKIELDGKIIVNPNEEIRNQFRQIIDAIDNQIDSGLVMDELYEILQVLKTISQKQYIYCVELIYQSVYSYFYYTRKQGEADKDFHESYYEYLCAKEKADVVRLYEKSPDFFLNYFIYYLGLSNLFHIKVLLEIEDNKKELLTKITETFTYDELALEQYIGWQSLEEYYYHRMDGNTEVEDVVEEVIYFLEYLHNNKPVVYKKYIHDIVKGIYKWCYYYVAHSIEVTEDCMEAKVISLLNTSTMEEYLFQDKQLLTQILIALFDITDFGYPTIETHNEIEDIFDFKLNNYLAQEQKQYQKMIEKCRQ